MKKLIIVGGPPACGKTFVAKLISESLKPIVYIDKDDLVELLHRSFELQGQPINMDGEFYAKNLHSAEYNTIIRIAFSALQYADRVILNAPFIKEARDEDYMRKLKEKAFSLDAELIFIWVIASPEVCLYRMRKRNLERDDFKLANWNEYIKTLDFSVPQKLVEKNAVDELIVFDTTDAAATANYLKKTLDIIKDR